MQSQHTDPLEGEHKPKATSEMMIDVLIGNYVPPWQVWITKELDVLEEISERLSSQDSLNADVVNPQLGEVYAFKTEKGWFRGCLDNFEPLTAVLIDLGQTVDSCLQMKMLSGLSKRLPPLAAAFCLFEGDMSSSVDINLKRQLVPNTKGKALLDDTSRTCSLWIDGQNVLEAAGHLITVEVTHMDADGSVWLARKKAAKRTEKLQNAAAGLAILDQVEVGTFCTARDMSNNKWFRAQVVGQTRLSHKVRLVDVGRIAEAVEMRHWWNKEEVEAKQYRLLMDSVDIGQQFFAVKRDWRLGNADIYNVEMKQVNQI